MQDFARTLGERLRETRVDAGMTQQTLASRAGVAVRTVARIESGEDVRLGTLVRLADALNTTAVRLIDSHQHAAAIGEHALNGDVIVEADELTAAVTGHGAK